MRIAAIAIIFVQLSVARALAADRPNIVVIISDDAGYADFSFQGSTEIKTPRLDSIAERGVRFSQGYVSASVCSPSRAGLMTGRYQQRFGHEANIPPRYSEVNGLPLSEVPLPAVLHDLGYRTIGLGKWHLGYADHYHPCSRGFNDFFGFLQGARSYRPLEQPTRLNRLLRDREVLTESFHYMTDELGRQAAAYIDTHHEQPFFMYLSFNAVHTPMHAREDDLAAIDGNPKPKRRKLIAMTVAMDRAVGLVLDALEAHELTDDTLLFFVNDNGGATNNASINAPLRGTKGTPFEGGIRIPFLVQWPARLPGGTVYDQPVSTLDIFATVLTAVGYDGVPPRPLDGVDLLPFLTGARKGRPHQTLYWRRGERSAVRDGDWKYVRPRGAGAGLFDLAHDPAEEHDLSAERPEVVAKLLELYDAWEAQLVEPRWGFSSAAGK